jgi:preprotein translocase subunit YajC
MKNAIISGVIIGVVSVLWIIGMQFFGYKPQNIEDSQNNWIEYTSVLIPFFGLYFGIRGLKKAQNGKLTFFEGLFEGFKIITVGGVLAAAASFIYIYFFAESLTIGYMERIFGAMAIGLLFTLANALLLMNGEKQKKY